MRRKRIWGMILAVCMLVQPISVLAEEKEQNGYLNIREYATGEKTQIYVKAEDKIIYAQPQETGLWGSCRRKSIRSRPKPEWLYGEDQCRRRDGNIRK